MVYVIDAELMMLYGVRKYGARYEALRQEFENKGEQTNELTKEWYKAAYQLSEKLKLENKIDKIITTIVSESGVKKSVVSDMFYAELEKINSDLSIKWTQAARIQTAGHRVMWELGKLDPSYLEWQLLQQCMHHPNIGTQTTDEKFRRWCVNNYSKLSEFHRNLITQRYNYTMNDWEHDVAESRRDLFENEAKHTGMEVIISIPRGC